MRAIFQKISKGLNNQLIKNILLVGGITFGVKVLSFFKETEVAASFGLSIFLDTFLIAILIPNFIQQVFIGSLNSLFIPNYIIEEKTTKQLGAFQSVSLISILGIVAVLSLGFIVFSVFFLETVFPDHDVEYYRLLRDQIYIVLPCILFWGLSSFGNALLEIEDHFFLSKVSMFYPPTITLICLFYFQDFFGDYVLAYSMLLGSIFVFIHLAYIVWLKKLLFISRMQINDNIREMIKQYVPKVTSSLLTGINPFVDQFFAAQLAIGSIAAINYGIKLPSFIISIVMIALSNVLLPHFSRAVTANFEKAYQQLKKIWSVAFLGSAIICIVLLFFSEDIIALFFERKEFTRENTLIVSKIQVIFLAHVPFYLCTLITVRFLTALNRNKFMAWVSFLNLILNIILNIIFIKYFEVYGLVLSTTVVYIIASFFYVGYAIRISKNQLA
ncbi:MAG: murein biosynthesis integral membrane protein MurJ [Allomuricauda sp.]